LSAPVATSDSLESHLVTLVGERILDPAAGLTAETNLYDAGLDSLAIMQLLLLIEEEFAVVIPVESVSRANFASIRVIAELLREKGGVATVGAPVAPEVVTRRPALPPVEVPPVTGPVLATMRGCDYFTLCFDQWSRKTGQGGHKAHSILMLDRVPELDRLRTLLDELPARFPLAFARLRRRGLFGALEWLRSESPAAVGLALYSEEGSAGTLLAAGAKSCADGWETASEIANTPLPRPGLRDEAKVRFTVIELRTGGAMFIFSWSHLLMDGVGAEFFLRELARLAGDCSGEAVPLLATSAPETFGWRDYFARAQPMIEYFDRLKQRRFDCLGPPRPRQGQTRFEVHTLTPEETRRANARCASLCGELMSMPFFLACAARAHNRVFAARGVIPDSHVCSVPVQTRRKGARGPVFQNHITMFFGVLSREEVAGLEGAVAALVAQHAAFHKNRLGEALDGLMQMMSVLPPGLYMRFIQFQMRGKFASFFHSHTGEFAPGLDQFFGAGITNAFHAPGIATPPGTGIFCNEKDGRLVITLSWQEGSLSAAERALILEQLRTDFGLDA
jgi:acyl carrier protein